MPINQYLSEDKITKTINFGKWYSKQTPIVRAGFISGITIALCIPITILSLWKKDDIQQQRYIDLQVDFKTLQKDTKMQLSVKDIVIETKQKEIDNLKAQQVISMQKAIDELNRKLDAAQRKQETIEKIKTTFNPETK